MLKEYSFLLNIIAGLTLTTAQCFYIAQLLKKKITPSLLTWFGWSILVGMALLSQFIKYGWNWTLLGHLSSALGCTFIFLFALFSKNYVILSKDWYYLILGILCIILYLLFSNPWLTTLFSIFADIILGIPTIVKAIKHPKTEKTIGWNIALFSWFFTLITCNHNPIIFLLFPTYCFLFNACMSFLTRESRIIKASEK